MKDEDLTNDLLQETLLKVYKFCLSSTGVKNVKSWLYQIPPNVMIDPFRKKLRGNHLLSENLPSRRR